MLLDNAIEAARRLDGAERKTISLVVSRRGDMAVIHEENYFDGEVRFENGLPVSTKGDPLNHGFGTRSMHQIVERYAGSMTMRVPELLMSTAGLPMASTVFMVTGSAAPRRLADVLAVASNGLPRIEAPMRSPMLDTALPTSRQGWMYWSL